MAALKIDSLFVRAFVFELAQQITGSRIEKVLQSDDVTLQIRLFPPRDTFLTLCASSKRPYLAVLADKLPVPPAPLRFCQLVRSRLEGGGVESFTQEAHDRIVRLVVRRREVEKEGEPPVDHRYELVAELFGAQADMYLFDLVEGRALGRLRSGPMPERLLEGYLPPPGGELPPNALQLDEAELARHVGFALTQGPSVLFRDLEGIPPGLAKLVVAIAQAHGAAAAAQALGAHLKRIVANDYEPAVITDERGAREVLLAPLDRLPAGWTRTPYASFLELARTVMVDEVRADDLAARRGAAAKHLAEMRKREEERLRHTRDNIARCGEADELERIGNLMKGQLQAILPYRDSAEIVDWYAPDAPKIKVAIKKNLTPQRNVERYFLRAKKLRHSVGALEARLAEHEDNLERLAGLEAELAAAVDRDGLEAVENRLRGVGRVAKARAPQGQSKNVRGAPAGPLEFVSSDGYKILVGRSNHENDHLSRKLAKGHDMWLHARGMAGAHVVVRMPRRDEECPPRTLEEAAQLAAHYSKGRYSGKVEVMIARAGQVKKAPGMAPGQVLVEGERTIMVRTDPQAPQRLAKPI